MSPSIIRSGALFGLNRTRLELYARSILQPARNSRVLAVCSRVLFALCTVLLLAILLIEWTEGDNAITGGILNSIHLVGQSGDQIGIAERARAGLLGIPTLLVWLATIGAVLTVDVSKRFWKGRTRLWPYLPALSLGWCGLGLILSLLVIFSSQGLLPDDLWKARPLAKASMLPAPLIEQQSAYVVCQLPFASSSHLQSSPVRVLENGVRLGPGNAPLPDISALGQGRNWFIYGCLYFSASDNSDPIHNGREYSIESPLFLTSREAQVLLWSIAIGNVVLLGVTWRLTLARIAQWLEGPIRSVSRVTSPILALVDWRADGLRGVGFLLSVVAYLGLLSIYIPSEIGLTARSIVSFPVFGILILILFLVYDRHSWLGDIAAFALTLAILALPLSGLWNSGLSNGVIIGGILPWSDASGYLSDAWSLAEGQLMSAFSGRRPWYASTLGALFRLSNGNLAITLAILSVLVAIACFALTREIQATHGTLVGVTVLTIMLFYYRITIGTNMTENLGTALGAIGLAVLWKGASRRQIRIIYLGLLLMTLALAARAGAFMVLPMLVLWGAWVFRGRSRLSISFLVGGIAAVFLGFSLDFALRELLTDSQSVAFSNYAYVLYGIGVGGKNWTQVMVDHPELLQLTDPELSARVSQLAWDVLRSNPMLALQGLLSAWRDYFSLTTNGAFGFINRFSEWNTETTFLNVAIWGLSAVGLFGCLTRLRDSSRSLTLAATIGILASVPLVPPIDSDSMRAYAATIPISAVWVGLGVATLSQVFGRLPSSRIPDTRVPRTGSVVFGLSIALFCISGPIAVKAFSSPARFEPGGCQLGLEPLYIRTNRTVLIHIVPDGEETYSHLPNIRYSDFTAHNGLLGSTLYPQLAEVLGGLKAGQTFLVGYEFQRRSLVYLVIEGLSLPSSPNMLVACARPPHSEWQRSYGFYYVESIQDAGN
jgi:hypothetical protein